MNKPMTNPARPEPLAYVAERVARIRSSISDGRGELVKDSRHRIANAATKRFRKDGFHKTKTRDIALELGVSQGHIYQYIERKEDILLLMLEAAADDYTRTLFPVGAEDLPPAEKLTRAMDAYYRIIDRHRDKTHVLYNHTSSLDVKDRKIFDQVERDVTEFFQRLLDDGVAGGVFRAVDTFLVAFDIVSLGHMWALKHHRFKGVMGLAAYTDAQTGHVLTILGAAE